MRALASPYLAPSTFPFSPKRRSDHLMACAGNANATVRTAPVFWKWVNAGRRWSACDGRVEIPAGDPQLCCFPLPSSLSFNSPPHSLCGRHSFCSPFRQHSHQHPSSHALPLPLISQPLLSQNFRNSPSPMLRLEKTSRLGASTQHHHASAPHQEQHKPPPRQPAALPQISASNGAPTQPPTARHSSVP
jgi:hypothetical protein